MGDFGLATPLESSETHVSALTGQGTLTHMAPELLLHGHISKRGDVYAFGILLWELFTGEKAFRGTPKALLPHQVGLALSFSSTCQMHQVGLVLPSTRWAFCAAPHQAGNPAGGRPV